MLVCGLLMNHAQAVDFNFTTLSFNVNCGNKILANISEFTVLNRTTCTCLSLGKGKGFFVNKSLFCEKKNQILMVAKKTFTL